jgi:hypothetical protein
MVSEKESGFSCQAEATLIKQAQAGSQESLNLLLLGTNGWYIGSFGVSGYVHCHMSLPSRKDGAGSGMPSWGLTQREAADSRPTPTRQL